MKKQLIGTRRDIIGGMAAIGSSMLLPGTIRAQGSDFPDDCSPIPSPNPPVPYQPQTSLPTRVRKSAFELSSSEQSRYQAAYQALRNLTQNSPNDPRGWLRQGYVHCWYCGGGNNGQAGEEIHGSWYFFPWHRAYLHFHERILCKLVGDDTFALAYWDWDSTGRQVFPSVFGNPNDANPLADTFRSATMNAAISRQCVSKGILNNTMNAPTNDLFMGDGNGTAGAMENAPHGPVHIWTGDTTLQNANTDMGVLATAAQDPVFFSHHSNIDRLWSVWLSQAQCHQNFTDPDWLGHKWQFYDENGVWTEISIAQVLDMEGSLQTRYQAPTPAPIWTSTGCPTPARPLAAAAVAPPAPAALPFVAAAQPRIALTHKPLTRRVRVPAAHRRLFKLKAQNRLDGGFVLRLHGITVPGHRQAMFHVFLNTPSATAGTGTNHPNLVGTVTVLAKSKRMRDHAHHRPVNAAFDVSDVVARHASRSQLSVTLVPVGASGAATDAPHARIEQVTLEQR